MVAEPRTYEIRVATGGSVVDRFVTAGVDGSADETAVENLADYSAWHDGTFTLYYVDTDGQTTRTAAIAEAKNGAAYELVDGDAIAADSMHNGPRVARVA